MPRSSNDIEFGSFRELQEGLYQPVSRWSKKKDRANKGQPNPGAQSARAKLNVLSDSVNKARRVINEGFKQIRRPDADIAALLKEIKAKEERFLGESLAAVKVLAA